jgi:GTP-binding protein YchF
MRVGILGLPNAGKSTLFNALTRSSAPAAPYPFTTIDPNVAVVPFADERLEPVAAAAGASGLQYGTVEFVDVAGLVEGAHRGEGLGNRFLAVLRDTEALVHVVRAHGDPGVVHPHGSVDPLGDVGVIETELALADLEQAQRRLEGVTRAARGGDRAAREEEAWLTTLVAALEGSASARVAGPPPEGSPLAPLTGKPVLFVANVGEGEEAPRALVEHAAAQGSEVIAVSARLESELSELDDADAAVMRAELGLGASGLRQVLEATIRLLDLIVFFTAHPGSPAQSRLLRRGQSAWDAAGRVHTDMQRGFVRAEVVPWDVLVAAGGYAAAREKGAVRVEGRDYVVADGDVLTIRFTP